MNITPLDRRILKNIPESVPESCTFEEAQGLNKFLWIYKANFGTNSDTPFSAFMTTEMGLQEYAKKELKEKGIVEFPLSDSIRYYTLSGEKGYVNYFDELDTQKLTVTSKMVEDILASGQEFDKARANSKHGGRMKSLLWALISGGIGFAVYLFGTSDFMNNSMSLGTLLTLPIIALIAIFAIVALYNLWHVFVPYPEDESVTKARSSLKTVYYDALRYIRLRVLWYQCIYETDKTPETLAAFQKQVDDAIRPWKKEVESAL